MDGETETAWEDIGGIVRRRDVAVTASSTRFTKQPDVRPPSTDAECRELRAWAESNPPHPVPAASQADLTRHISFMAATLPSKGVDDLSGKMRVAVYQSLLAGYSNDALAFMARRACQTLDWFPTPRQCLDLLADYQRPETPQGRALRLCHDYSHASFDRWLVGVRAGQPMGEVSERWLRVAVEQGVARRLSDGSYVSRALYHGPFKAYVAEVPAPPPPAAIDELEMGKAA